LIELKSKIMKTGILESEQFGNGKRTYFLDFSRAANDSNYIRITRSDRQADNSYTKSSVCIFEEDFHFLIEGFSMLFTSMIDREGRSAKKSQISNSAEKGDKPRGIKSWPVEMRPRERFLANGPGTLSDAELLALLIVSGTTKQSAVDLAASILKSVNGDLNALCRCSTKSLAKFHGIGDAKAITILAAMELSNRSRQLLKLPFKLKAG